MSSQPKKKFVFKPKGKCYLTIKWHAKSRRVSHLLIPASVAHPLSVGKILGSILGPNYVIAKDVKSCATLIVGKSFGAR